MYRLQYRPQMVHTPYPENGGSGEAAAPHFLHIYYGPSVACAVGCTWLMYSLCVAHIWPMYDLHMAHIVFRSAISSAIRSAIRSAPCTDHQGILAEKMVDLTADNDCRSWSRTAEVV